MAKTFYAANKGEIKREELSTSGDVEPRKRFRLRDIEEDSLQKLVQRCRKYGEGKPRKEHDV